MERQSNRAFAFCFVVFTLFLIVSSGTDHDDQPQSVDKSSDDKNVASVTKVDGSADGERTEAQNENGTNAKKPNIASEELEKNCTVNKNDAECKAQDDGSFVTRLWHNLGMSENRNMLLRAIYVCLGVTAIVIIFFIIRAVGLRRRRNKSRKYGVITTRGDLEMEPLGQGEDEDDDYTVFEMNGRHK